MGKLIEWPKKAPAPEEREFDKVAATLQGSKDICPACLGTVYHPGYIIVNQGSRQWTELCNEGDFHRGPEAA